jgi:hypothetical protein
MRAVHAPFWVHSPRVGSNAARPSSCSRFAIWLLLTAVFWAFGYSLGFETGRMFNVDRAAVSLEEQ